MNAIEIKNDTCVTTHSDANRCTSASVQNKAAQKSTETVKSHSYAWGDYRVSNVNGIARKSSRVPGEIRRRCIEQHGVTKRTQGCCWGLQVEGRV